MLQWRFERFTNCFLFENLMQKKEGSHDFVCPSYKHMPVMTPRHTRVPRPRVLLLQPIGRADRPRVRLSAPAPKAPYKASAQIKALRQMCLKRLWHLEHLSLWEQGSNRAESFCYFNTNQQGISIAKVNSWLQLRIINTLSITTI